MDLQRFIDPGVEASLAQRAMRYAEQEAESKQRRLQLDIHRQRTKARKVAIDRDVELRRRDHIEKEEQRIAEIQSVRESQRLASASSNRSTQRRDTQLSAQVADARERLLLEQVTRAAQRHEALMLDKQQRLSNERQLRLHRWQANQSHFMLGERSGKLSSWTATTNFMSARMRPGVSDSDSSQMQMALRQVRAVAQRTERENQISQLESMREERHNHALLLKQQSRFEANRKREVRAQIRLQQVQRDRLSRQRKLEMAFQQAVSIGELTRVHNAHHVH